MYRFKSKDFLILVAPAVFLLALGWALPHLRQPVGPAALTVDKVLVESISTARAVDEICTPVGQTPIPGGVKLFPKYAAQYKGIDHKVTVELNYRGAKPTWWARTS